jgi:hypothetical protein
MPRAANEEAIVDRGRIWAVRTVAVTLMLAIGACVSNGEYPTDYQVVQDEFFSFEVPPGWRSMTSDETAAFRTQFTQASTELYQEYHGKEEPYEAGVPYIRGFFAPRLEATFVVLVMNIPVQADGYLDQIQAQSVGVIQWGLDNGQLREARSNERVSLHGFPAHYTDLTMSDGSRMSSYGLFLPSHPGQVIQMSMLCDPGKEALYGSALERMVQKMTIRFVHVEGH